MEKVEKLLLLVVLGAAMIIMSVMSFGSEDPAVTPGGTAAGTGSENQGSKPVVAQIPAVDPSVDPGVAGGPRASAGRRNVEDMWVDAPPPVNTKPHAGKPSLVNGNRGDDHSSPNPAERVYAIGNGLNPLKHKAGSGSQPDLSRTTPGLHTADLALKPGDDPRIWIYEVQPNESMGGIATKITGSQKNMYEIASFNEGMDLNRIRTGQKIQIPSYLIQDRKLVQNGGGTPNALAKAGAVPTSSGLSGRRIVPGMIRVPEKRDISRDRSSRAGTVATREATSPVRSKTVDYRIRKGETLWAIAKRRVGERGAMAYVREIQGLNPDLDPTSLREKEIILLPAR